MRLHTDDAASSKYFTGAEQETMERRLTPYYSPVWVAAQQRLIAKGLRELRGLNQATMTASQRLSAELIRWDLEEQRDRAKYASLRFPFGEYRGPQVSLPQRLTVEHSINSQRDAENYLARLGQVAPRMEEALAVSRQLAAEKITSGQIYPVWRKAIAQLGPLVAQATDDAGLCRFKDGAAAYQHALRRYTTTKLTPDQIHQTGLEMVATLEKRMDDVLRRSGRTQGTVAEPGGVLAVAAAL